MKAAHQVFEKQLEHLRQAKHRLAGDDEGSHLLAAILDNLALVGGGVVGGDGGGRGTVAEGTVHELGH